jgi:hypothetical protein
MAWLNGRRDPPHRQAEDSNSETTGDRRRHGHHVCVAEQDDQLDVALVREAELVRAARRAELRELTPTQRLERLHALCAQLSSVAATPVRDAP